MTGVTHIGDYGEIGGSNASPAIQAMINTVGYFTLPVGTFQCQDTIVIPASSTKSLGSLFSGHGRERSRLVASGMAGASLIKSAPGGYQRLTMRDFALSGDADTALDLRVGLQLYKSHFTDMDLASKAGPAMLTDNVFSTSWESCSFSSDLGNAFESPGGNTVMLSNCYAHKCGPDKAGYRITGRALLVSCNGMDMVGSGHFWGHFGRPDGYYSVALTHCNIEDFGSAGLLLEGLGGRLKLDGVSFVAPHTGQYETCIKGIGGSKAHNIMIDHMTTVGSNGATRSGLSNIVLPGANNIIALNNTLSGETGQFIDYRNTIYDITYPIPTLTMAAGTYGQTDLKVNRLKAGVVSAP